MWIADTDEDHPDLYEDPRHFSLREPLASAVTEPVPGDLIVCCGAELGKLCLVISSQRIRRGGVVEAWKVNILPRFDVIVERTLHSSTYNRIWWVIR